MMLSFEVAVTTVVVLCLTPSGFATCNVVGWEGHQLEVVSASSFSSLNTSNLPLNASLYGVEGGHAIVVGQRLYTIIAEFTGPPHFVPSNIALWKADLPLPQVSTVASVPSIDFASIVYTRVGTMFKSEGKVDCTSLRSSLGSSAALAFNTTTNRFELFYVGFKSCNDTNFVNRLGRIFRAESVRTGNDAAGVEGPYRDLGVVMEPDSTSQPWEGLQGVDSMQPYAIKDGWIAFYGSANTQQKQNLRQTIGQATSSSLAGPWTRVPNGPSNLSALAYKIEQPMVTRLNDGTYVALFDALEEEGQGDVGYSWSADGVHWDPECTQLLQLLPQATWLKRMRARTPQGLVQLSEGRLLLSFSGYDFTNATMAMHEALGLAQLKWKSTG